MEEGKGRRRSKGRSRRGRRGRRRKNWRGRTRRKREEKGKKQEEGHGSRVGRPPSYLHGVDQRLGDCHSQGTREEALLKGRGPVRTAEEVLALGWERGRGCERSQPPSCLQAI
jgi:hypothetical protein